MARMSAARPTAACAGNRRLTSATLLLLLHRRAYVANAACKLCQVLRNRLGSTVLKYEGRREVRQTKPRRELLHERDGSQRINPNVH